MSFRMESPGTLTTAPLPPASMAASQRHQWPVLQQNRSFVSTNGRLSQFPTTKDAALTMNVNVSCVHSKVVAQNDVTGSYSELIGVICLSCVGVCNVWGGENYLTFDGRAYDFSKNCTYYLVKEIVNKYNLTITAENGCATSKTILCLDILTVIYGSTEVVFKAGLVNTSTPVLEVRNNTMQTSTVIA